MPTNINFAQRENLEKGGKFLKQSTLLLGAVLFLFLLAWGGIYGWKKYIEREIDTVVAHTIQEKERVPQEQVAEVMDFQIRMDSIKKKLPEKHNVNDDLMRIEHLVIPEVTLTSVKYVTGGKIEVEALAVDFESIARQLKALKDSGEITQLVLKGDSNERVDEGVAFEFSFHFVNASEK